MQAVWFRNNLRIHDNPALYGALQDKALPTIAIFCATSTQWQQHHMAPSRIFFIKESLRHLEQQLKKLHVPLIVLDIATFQQIPKALKHLCQQHQIIRLWLSAEYEYNEQTRDQQCLQHLSPLVDIKTCHDQSILPPGAVAKQDGQAYTVFTPYSRAWKKYWLETQSMPLPAPKSQKSFDFKTPPWPKWLQEFKPSPANSFWQAGEEQALRQLKHFQEYRMANYHIVRDRPDLDSTSRLSPHLAIGTLSARQCLISALALQKNDLLATNTGSATWINELIWRDFYKHLLVYFPHLSRHQPFKKNTDNIAWLQTTSTIHAWQCGLTGFPLVDAAMRQLQTQGWMHNRLRMITSMFFSKNLFIDWRIGEKFFMQHLIDGDLAANNGGWQWCASTGTDAAPYFRIFNPITQSKKCDPNGAFIRAFIPELRKLDSLSIHNPNPAQRKETSYTNPIIDLKISRERTLQAFKNIK